jgi:hypothetical protein
MYQIYQYILFIGLVLIGIGVVVLTSVFPKTVPQRGLDPDQPLGWRLAEAALGFALAALGAVSAIVGWVGLT